MTAAVRELREETGITSARLVSLVCACSNPRLCGKHLATCGS